MDDVMLSKMKTCRMGKTTVYILYVCVKVYFIFLVSLILFKVNLYFLLACLLLNFKCFFCVCVCFF